MSEVFLYLRKFNHVGTIVYKIDGDEASNIIKKYKDSPYEMGILIGKDIHMLNKIYREYAPYREITSKDKIMSLIQSKSIDLKLCPTIEMWRKKDLKVTHKKNVKEVINKKGYKYKNEITHSIFCALIDPIISPIISNIKIDSKSNKREFLSNRECSDKYENFKPVYMYNR